MSPAPSSDRDAVAKSAELDDSALAELREFTAALRDRNFRLLFVVITTRSLVQGKS